jgi:hypothetical protein
MRSSAQAEAASTTRVFASVRGLISRRRVVHEALVGHSALIAPRACAEAEASRLSENTERRSVLQADAG